MESNYPSNSNKQKKTEVPAKETEPKKVEQITSGNVVRRKKPLGKRFAETFVGGDAKGVVGYVVYEVLIPAARDMVADAGREAIERMLYGEQRSPHRRGGSARPSGANGYVSYNRFAPGQSSSRNDDPRPSLSRKARASHDFDEIILASRVEAEEVIDRLFDLVSRYESATVADLYEMVGVTGNYTDDKWGWSDIRGAGVTRVRNGYLLDLPKPEPLD